MAPERRAEHDGARRAGGGGGGGGGDERTAEPGGPGPDLEALRTAAPGPRGAPERRRAGRFRPAWDPDAVGPVEAVDVPDHLRAGEERPVHLRAPAIAVVALGGAVGTAAREAVAAVTPAPGELPLATLTVNLLGAFALGLLLEGIARRGPDVGGRRLLRLLLGTGLMGGFTTYSALTVDTAGMIRGGDVGLGVGYAVATVVIGAVATLAGIALAGWRRARGDRA